MKIRYVQCPTVCEVDLDDARFEKQLKERIHITESILRNLREATLAGEEKLCHVLEVPDAESVPGAG